MTDQPLITEDWLSKSGFMSYQEERQPSKHWRLWLGWGSEDNNACIHDIGIEVASMAFKNRNGDIVGDGNKWFCWIIGHNGSRKIIHVRAVSYQQELTTLVSALTGQAWDTENHMCGNCYRPSMAEKIRAEFEGVSQ